MKNVVALLVLLLICFNGWGCAAGIPLNIEVLDPAPVVPADVEESPPLTFSVSGFSPEQTAVIREGMWAWCEAVDLCPLEVESDGVFQILLVHDYASYGRPKNSAAFTRGARTVRVDGDREAVMTDLGNFAVVVWHELGHFGIDGHTDTGLMSAEAFEGSLPALEVDQAAVAMWNAQNH